MSYTHLAFDLEAFDPGRELLNLSLAGEGGFMVRTGRWFSGHEMGVSPEQAARASWGQESFSVSVWLPAERDRIGPSQPAIN